MRHPRRVVGIDPVQPECLPLELHVVAGRYPDEHAGVAAVEGGRHLARPLQRLPRHLQHEALLRVHADRLARGDVEEQGVELVDVLDKPPAPAGDLPGRLRIGVVVRVDVPPVGRDVGDGVAALAEKLPEGLGRVARPGKPARHPDDGDRLPALRLSSLEPRLHVF